MDNFFQKYFKCRIKHWAVSYSIGLDPGSRVRRARIQGHGVPFVCGRMCVHIHLHLWEVNAITDRCTEGSVHVYVYVYVKDEDTYTQIYITYANMRNGCVHTWGHEGTHVCMSIPYG